MEFCLPWTPGSAVWLPGPAAPTAERASANYQKTERNGQNCTRTSFANRGTKVLSDRSRKTLKETGYVVVRAMSEPAVLAVARQLGTPVADVRDDSLYRLISPTDKEIARTNTLSSRYGTGAFPFHTDAAYWRVPADFLLLHCVQPGSGSRPTLLIDFFGWRLKRDELLHLTRGLWIAGDKRAFLCTAVTRAEEGARVRYDADCMRPTTATGQAASQLMLKGIRKSKPASVTWRRGMLLILDNRRILHARGKPTAPDGDRQLGRVLVGGCV